MALDPRMFLWYAINGVAAWTETAFFIVGIVCMMALMGFMALTALFTAYKMLRRNDK